MKSTAPLLLMGSARDCPDIEYVTGFRPTDPVVLLDFGYRKMLIVSQMEAERARVTSPHVEVCTPEDFAVRSGGRRSWADILWSVLAGAGCRVVRIPGTFPYAVAYKLRRKGMRLTVVDGPPHPERAVKRRDEIEKISAAQQAAVVAMRAAVRMIAAARIGVGGELRDRGGKILTAEAVRETVWRVLIDQRCFCGDVIVACGRQSANPHETGSGPLRAGQPIVVDIFPQHLEHGYFGDLTRTLVWGKAPPALRMMYEAVKAAQEAAVRSLRPGVKGRTVHRAAMEVFKKLDFHTRLRPRDRVGFIHGTGHGVGLAIHEGPSLGLNNDRLRAGNVVTVEPGLYYPSLGGVRIEDVVVVTTKGARRLVPCEDWFEI